MNKVFIGIGMTGITSAAAFLQFTKHVRSVSVPLPADAPALKPLLEHARPLHVDVCQVHVPSNVSARQFARAFFTSPVLRVERRILQAVGAGSVSDEEIKRMDFAVGDRVAMFEVVDCQQQTTDEIMLCWDPRVVGHSWMEAKPSTDAKGGTTLSFGSILDVKQGSPLVNIIMPFHLLYAKIVLASAQRQLAALNSVEPAE